MKGEVGETTHRAMPLNQQVTIMILCKVLFCTEKAERKTERKEKKERGESKKSKE